MASREFANITLHITQHFSLTRKAIELRRFVIPSYKNSATKSSAAVIKNSISTFSFARDHPHITVNVGSWHSPAAALRDRQVGQRQLSATFANGPFRPGTDGGEQQL